jgi:hypothetical protein
VDKFIEERAKFVRSLAEEADPFIKIRLLKLAEHYEGRLGTPSKDQLLPTPLPER